ncbi:DUF6325 family protein [Paractinoplanes rhizophilus]|jgi:hypothetical protein|uniref:DUF6325 family protein n=1 Tax=Paractinoplanes rhizophilus TaxID=1416877 RepID=A0ABW2I202_9ACTN
MMDDLQEMGPVDYLCLEFPPGSQPGQGLPHIVSLVDRGIIRVLDLRFLRKNADGTVNELVGEQLDTGLALFQGAASGMIGGDDLEEAAAVLEPGSAAALIVYENVWAAPFAVAVRRAGGRVIAGGRIPVQSLLAALDATESEFVRS